jgi:mono/diheme cytochrome c family protein
VVLQLLEKHTINEYPTRPNIMYRPATPRQGFKWTLGYAVILIGFINFSSQAISQEADVGQANFVTYCAECHGIDGRGKGTRSTALSTKPADLTLLAKKSKGKFNPSFVFRMIDGRMPGARVHLSEEMAPARGSIANAHAGAHPAGVKVKKAN